MGRVSESIFSGKRFGWPLKGLIGERAFCFSCTKFVGDC